MGRLIDSTYIHFEGSQEAGNDPSLRNAYANFREQMVGKGYAPSTLQSYDNHVVEFIDYLDASYSNPGIRKTKEFPCAEVKRDHLICWQGVLRCERGNKDSSIRTKVKSIRTFLYWCMDEDRGYCKRFKIKLPKATEELKEPYSPQEIEAMLAKPQSQDLSEWRTWAAISLMLRTGMRRSSVCELKWSDVDYEGKTVLMRHSKTGKQQFIPLPTNAIEDLKLWKSVSSSIESDYIFFSTYKETKLSPNSLTQAVRKYNLNRGISKTSVHLIRHTYATTYLRKGGRAEKLQKILGHQTAEMTQRYVHFITSDLTEDVDDFTV